ncbi:cupin domain-containing protein [Rhodanobacter umsongensis]|uniref:Cupin domain-containing protein n=1 Tax=Rhodanobacter umsongensis TaxID=633153 RepID=A0ABW0JHM8_9GAMM
MDALSEVLKTIRLDGAMYINAEFTAPWCAAASYGLPRATAQTAGADHIVFFHCLTEGQCNARLVDGEETLSLRSGDLILFPHDHRHLLGSDLQLPPVDADSVTPKAAAGELIQLRHGGGGVATRFVCGYLACNRRVSKALLAALPEMLRIPLRDDLTGTWLFELLLHGVNESSAQRPGAQSILAKLSELLFAEALRRYASCQPGQQGWLAGLQDPIVGRALALLHRQPAHAWTVEALAGAVASSRSVLAERFTRLTGESPMQYLTGYRLALAAQALRSGRDGIASIAANVGYGSEAAFTRAFKREFELPPAAWRKREAIDVAGASPGSPATAPAAPAS